MADDSSKAVPEAYRLMDDGTYPNNERLPALVYRAALDPGSAKPTELEALFQEHGWSGGWRNGVFPFHHYHSTAHEVLGCYSGEATVLLGGPSGRELKLGRGDVVVIPAGVSHRRISASSDFAVVGAYAGGRDYDMNRGDGGERPRADENISRVPLPEQDPVHGRDGPIFAHWRASPDVPTTAT